MDNIQSPFEYVSNQLKIFVLNRLAQSSSTTQQLVCSFSVLVDDLALSEDTLNHVLDVLCKENAITFQEQDGIRYYNLINFYGDNIFDLDLENIERLIVENDVPYYENSTPSLSDDLYFEKIDDKICIHITKPISPSVFFATEEPSESLDNETASSDNETSIGEEDTAEPVETSDLCYKTDINTDEIQSHNEISDENTDTNVIDQKLEDNSTVIIEKQEEISSSAYRNDGWKNPTFDFDVNISPNQESYDTKGNTDETDDIINSLFAKHLSEVKADHDLASNEKSDDELDKKAEVDNNSDDIVFSEPILPSSFELSPEEEARRIDNALKKLEELSSQSENKEDENKKIETSEELPNEENVENSYSQNAQPDFSAQIEERPSNVLSVRSYIAEQEKIHNYDWEKKLNRAFTDHDNDFEETVEVAENNVILSTYSELKDIMEKKNYKFKAYSNYDSVSFYSQNYVFSSRLAKDTSIYTYVFLLLELIIAYFFVDKYINKGILPYLICAICLVIIPVFFILKYVYLRDKRKPANFSFSISIVTALMIYVNLMVMVVLLAFFVPSLNVSITDVKSMITPIFYPAGLLLAIPFSVCVYSILYHSKRYHLH